MEGRSLDRAGLNCYPRWIALIVLGDASAMGANLLSGFKIPAIGVYYFLV